MIFKRGNYGDLRLNGCIKVWVPVILGMILAAMAIVDHVMDWIEAVEQCDAQGGAWVGGAMPGAYCVEAPEEPIAW